jgi:hypothetical protein
VTRALPGAVDTAVQQETIRIALLLELNLDSGDVNMWSGIGDLTWDSKTWSGLGDLGSISGVDEAGDLSDARIRATLSLIDGGDLLDLVDELTDQDPVGRGFALYLAFFNEDTAIDDVLTLTAGFIDAVTFSDGAIAGASVSLASEATLLRREHFYRLDDAMQQSLFASDKGLEFVTDLSDEINWGSAPPHVVQGGGGGGDRNRVLV